MCHRYKIVVDVTDERLSLTMEFPLMLTVVIAAFIWTQWQKTDDWNDDVYADFKEMLRESSEMCDAAIRSVSDVLSHKTNRNARSSAFLNEFFAPDRSLANVSKSVGDNCEERSWEDVENLSACYNPEECLEMIEIEEQLEGIYVEMLQSGKEIASIKEEFPDIIEANCSEEEDGEACRFQVLLSVKSHVADLLTQASLNMKIINEIIRIYRRNAALCFEKNLG